jgi:glucose-6-phosphate isomerase
MPKDIRIDTKYLAGAVSEKDLDGIFAEVKKAHECIQDKSGPGSEYLGWIDLPERITGELLSDIQKTADTLKETSDIIVVIGIGGSYLGAKALIDSIGDSPDRQYRGLSG